jgi:hypothetical protein
MDIEVFDKNTLLYHHLYSPELNVWNNISSNIELVNKLFCNR